jgi:hypothetical protein
MKIEIFSDPNYADLEKEINRWLEDKPEIEVISQSQSTGKRDHDGKNHITIAIMYRETSSHR